MSFALNRLEVGVQRFDHPPFARHTNDTIEWPRQLRVSKIRAVVRRCDENTMTCAGRWAAGLGNRFYAIDDQMAIAVVDGNLQVIPEGNWRNFEG